MNSRCHARRTLLSLLMVLFLGMVLTQTVQSARAEAGSPPVAGQVRVLGQVMRAGPTPIFAKDCLLLVIARVGGFTSAAKSNAVEVIRKKSDGGKEKIIVDCNAKPSETPEGKHCGTFVLQPDDVVFVPEAPR